MKEINDEIIQQNIQPRVFLASSLLPLNIVRQVKKIFAIDYKSLDGMLFFYSKNGELTHKEKAVVLFMAGVFISCKSPQASLCLGQFNVLEFRMRNYEKLSSEIELLETECEDFLQWDQESNKIYVSPILKIYLEHAQIKFQGTKLKGLDYAASEVGKKKPRLTLQRKAG